MHPRGLGGNTILPAKGFPVPGRLPELLCPELRAIITPDVLRRTSFMDQLVQRLQHLQAGDALLDPDLKALPGVLVHDHQQFQLLAVFGLVMHEVVASHLVPGRCFLWTLFSKRLVLLPRPLSRQRQSLQPVEPFHALMIHSQTISAKQRRESGRSVAPMPSSRLHHLVPDQPLDLIHWPRPVAGTAAADHQDKTGPAF